MTLGKSDKQKPRFFYGWWIVFVAFLGDVIAGGMGPQVFGLFVIPMSADLGISRGALSLGLTARTIAGAATGPILGPIVDRRGARAIMVVGAFLGGFAAMSVGAVQNVAQFTAAYAAMGVLGTAGSGPLVTTTVVAKWFVRHRGRAIAIATVGFAVGQITFGPLTQILISSFGWRMAWVILGFITWVVLIPPALIFMRRVPEDMGLRPDGDSPQPEIREPVQGKLEPDSGNRTLAYAEEYSWTLGEATKTPALWLLASAFFLGSVALSGMSIHTIAAIMDKGFSLAIGAMYLTIFGICSSISRMFFGVVSERVPIRYTTAVMFAGSGVGVMILMGASTLTMIIVFSVVYGTMRGPFSTLNPIIWADYFGSASLATIRGTLAPIQIGASATGPLMAGFMFDLSGSYRLPFSIFVVFYVAAAVVVLMARPPRLHRGSSSPTSAS